MNKPKQRKNESDLSYAFRVACWLSDAGRLARHHASMIENGSGTITIKRPTQYIRSLSPDTST